MAMRTRAARALVSGVVVLTFVFPAVASASVSHAGGAKIPPLIAFGDAQSVLPDVPVSTALSGLPACGHGGVSEPTFAKALAQAGQIFKGSAAQGEKKLDAAKYSGTAGRAEVFAAGAAAVKAPEAALAALLDARRRATRDPMLLVDASVFLTELGHPADALAFLDHASKLGRASGTVMGLKDAAVELNDRGFALLGMHRYAEAVAVLRSAVSAGGRLLSEASINEAQALHCDGKPQDSFHALVAGAYRQTYDLVEDDNTSGEATAEQPAPAQLGFTRPDGPADTLPPLKYPTSEADAQSASKGFHAFVAYILGQAEAIQRTEDSQSLSLFKQLQKAPPLTRQRTNEILSLIGQAGPNEPATKDAFSALETAQNNMDNFLAQFSGQAPPSPCGHYGQWLSLMQTLDLKMREYYVAASKYEAPLVAHLANPLAHKLALESLQAGGDFNVSVLANTVIDWMGLVSACVVKQTPVKAPADQGADAGDPGECPPILGPDSVLALNIPGLMQIAVNCESVSGTVEGEGLVGPFISGERTASGETTIFGGAKVGVNLGPFGGELQEGFYIKSGPSGIEDWGVRISPSASGGAGPVSIGYGSAVDLSFVGAIDYIPTAFGFR
jgi:hypothetical protein